MLIAAVWHGTYNLAAGTLAAQEGINVAFTIFVMAWAAILVWLEIRDRRAGREAASPLAPLNPEPEARSAVEVSRSGRSWSPTVEDADKAPKSLTNSSWSRRLSGQGRSRPAGWVATEGSPSPDTPIRSGCGRRETVGVIEKHRMGSIPLRCDGVHQLHQPHKAGHGER